METLINTINNQEVIINDLCKESVSSSDNCIKISDEIEASEGANIMIRVKEEDASISKIEDIEMINEQNDLDSEITNEGETKEGEVEKLKVIKLKSKDKARASRSGNGVSTVVNSKKNGKRITFSKELMEGLGNPDSIELGCTNEGILVGRKLPENGEKFKLRKSGKKSVIYSAALVEEITEVFELDFSNRVSITFVDAEEIEYEVDSPIIEIKVK